MNRLMKSVTRAVSAVLLSGALTVAAALPARAQWMGELSSTLMTPLPPRPSFAVRIYDDTKVETSTIWISPATPSISSSP